MTFKALFLWELAGEGIRWHSLKYFVKYVKNDCPDLIPESRKMLTRKTLSWKNIAKSGHRRFNFWFLQCFRKTCTQAVSYKPKYQNVCLDLEGIPWLTSFFFSKSAAKKQWQWRHCLAATGKFPHFLKAVPEKLTKERARLNTHGLITQSECTIWCSALPGWGLELRLRLNWALSHSGAAPGFRWMPACINHSSAEQSTEPRELLLPKPQCGRAKQGASEPNNHRSPWIMHESRTLPGTSETVLGGTVLSKIAETRPWNMHSLKFILAAATWGKLKANMTSTWKSWYFRESEAPRICVNTKKPCDKI